MHASEVTPEVSRKANELYWGSARSVNQIAEQLDLSKGALYAVIAPDPSGLGCPLCGSEVAFPNRTAKERELLDCPTCNWDGSADETVTYEIHSHSAHAPAPTDLEEYSSDGFLADDRGLADRAPLPPLMTPRLRAIAGGALIGSAVGLALVLWARRQ